MIELRISLKDSKLQQDLAKIEKRLENPKPLHGIIGAYLNKSHEQRFKDKKAPDDTKWQALSPSTLLLKQKRNKNLGILVMNADLRNKPSMEYDKYNVVFGTNCEYGGIMQFGSNRAGRSKNTKIPARPWLGLSQDDREIIMEKVKLYIEK